IYKDIHEKKQAEEKLKESEEQFRTITEQSLLGVAILQDEVYKYANKQFATIYGRSIDEILNLKPGEYMSLVHEDHKEYVSEQAKRKQLGLKDQTNQYEFKGIKKDGEVIWVEIFSKTIMFENKTADLILVTDITDKKRTEDMLKESEQKFRIMSEQSLLGIFIVQEEIFKYVNHQLAEITGYSIEEMLSWEPKVLYKKLIHPDYIHILMEQGAKKQRGDSDVIIHYQFKGIKKNGETFWADMYSKSIQFQGKTADLGTLIDITEKKIAEEKLIESKNNFEKIAEQNLVGLGILQDNKVKYINKKAAENFGTTREELLNMSFSEFSKFIHPSDLNMEIEFIKETLSNPEKIIEYQGRAIKSSGEITWNDVMIKQIQYEQKPALLGIFRDITEKKKAEERLKESEEKFRTIAEQTFIGLAVIQDGRFKYVNQTFADTIGYTTKEILNWKSDKYLDFIHPDDKEYVLERTKKIFIDKNSSISQNSFRVYKKSGEIIWIETNAKIINYEGMPALIIAQMDITEKKLAQEILLRSEKKYREAYERENFYKDLFAHDMNNILQGILTSLELCALTIKNTEKPGNILEMLNIIREQMNRGSDLVNNVRMFSEIESSKPTLKELNIIEVLKEALKVVEKSSLQKEQKIKIETSKDSVLVQGDQFLLNAFENLIHNSVKHNDKSIIEIFLRTSILSKDAQEYLKIEFIDNARGIPDSKKESIFNRGFKEDKSVSGMGLGLSLVKKILDRYDAKIWVEDRIPGDHSKGSNFIILYPLLN
ncbi:MAG: PAS domain-containing sensor histidine kinase, partial [Promethearchaeota archaeon]